MADNTVARLSGESPEQVAYKLLVLVGAAEQKLYMDGSPYAGTGRKWILDTYAECLLAVKNTRSIAKD
ncbi:MAG: hypothetical protein DI589_23035 [Shinella sp.]|nr:MAG: hypothetical protein DI589_23035 [Shinella sp.]